MERKTNEEMGNQFGALEDGTTNKSSGVGKWMVGVETSKVVEYIQTYYLGN